MADRPRDDRRRGSGWRPDGPRRDGPRRDGPRKDGPPRGGPRRDEPSFGPRRDGPPFDGPRGRRPFDGPRDGPGRHDPDRQRPGPGGPGPFERRLSGPRGPQDRSRPSRPRDHAGPGGPPGGPGGPPGGRRPAEPRPERGGSRLWPTDRFAPGPRPRPGEDRGGYTRNDPPNEPWQTNDRPQGPDRGHGDRSGPGGVDRPGYGPRQGGPPGRRPFTGPPGGRGPGDRPYRPRPEGGRPYPRTSFEPRYGGPPRPSALPSPEALGPDEELVAGRRPVEEAFVARRPAIRLLVVPQRRAALEKLVLHATNLRIPIVEVEGGSLTALAGFDGHQGVALVVEPRQFASLDDVLARAAERDEPPFILVLDSLEDPHNVGTLLRSAEAAGVHGVLFPTHRQAPLSPSAVKASAGAIEHLLLCPVDDLPGALSDLHTRGVRIAGAEGDAPMTARQSDLRGPLAIVVGSEGQGLGPAVRRRADLFMRIPMKGAVGSLNAAVAGSILLFEALAQRDPNATPSDRPVARIRRRGRVVRAREGPPLDEGHEGPQGARPQPTEPVVPDEPVRRRHRNAAPAETKPKPRARKGLSTEPEDVNATTAIRRIRQRPRRHRSDADARLRPSPSRSSRRRPARPPRPDRRAKPLAGPARPRRPRPPIRRLLAEAGEPDEDLLPTDGPEPSPAFASPGRRSPGAHSRAIRADSLLIRSAEAKPPLLMSRASAPVKRASIASGTVPAFDGPEMNTSRARDVRTARCERRRRVRRRTPP